MKTLPVNARRIRWSGLLLLVTAIIARPARGQNQELTFSLGGIPSQTRSSRRLPVSHKFPRIAVWELTTATVSWMRG
jgi:hypothetical protein